jgi:glycosyltransferase involved in cell wall biosynthesis
MTKISIVTPSLNQGRFLGEALESVRLQGHSDVEHLVLDGGSTDETIALLQSHDGMSDWSHVRWQSGRDGGQSEALNRGFAEATGEIIGWLNSDDRYRPGCFDHVVRAFAENPGVDVFYGDYTFMDQSGKIQKVRREIEFNRFVLCYHRVCYIPTTSTFFRRRIFEEQNWLKQDLHYAMDYEFFLRLVAAGYRIRRIPQVIADFRLHPASKTCRMTRTQLREKQSIMRSFSALPRKIGSPFLQFVVLLSLQIAAATMRWSEKMIRGRYVTQYRTGSRVEK